MKSKKLILFIVLMGSALLVNAQSKSIIQYNVGIPMGELKDYISPVSARGVSYDYQYMMTDQIAIGFGLGWQVFYEEIGEFTEVDGTSTISGYQYRYLNSFPAHFTGTYYFSTGGNLQPYAGLGIGIVYDLRNTDFGVFTVEDDAWHFSLRPELGLYYDASYRFGVRLNARYVQGFNTKDLDGQNYLALGLGFVFKN